MSQGCRTSDACHGLGGAWERPVTVANSWIRGLRIVLGSVLLAAHCPVCAAPGIMTYQGKLADSGGVPISTPVNLTFTFWDAEAGGSQLGGGFSDMDPVTPSSSGLVTTDIGDDPGNPVPASIFATDSVWLNVSVGGSDLPRTRVYPAGSH